MFYCMNVAAALREVLIFRKVPTLCLHVQLGFHVALRLEYNSAASFFKFEFR